MTYLSFDGHVAGSTVGYSNEPGATHHPAMSSSPPAKRQKQSSATKSPTTAVEASTSTTSAPPAASTSATAADRPTTTSLPSASDLPTARPLDTAPPLPTSPTTPGGARKRRVSQSSRLNTLPPGTSLPSEASASMSIPALLSGEPTRKPGRTNTPWSAGEEQRLKQMRDAGKSWGEIAKAFPNRTEGSVKKHWYKDMHYAEFAKDESDALRDAIKEYEANKWKAIGLKLGKPAKACEQYAREHFKNT